MQVMNVFLLIKDFPSDVKYRGTVFRCPKFKLEWEIHSAPELRQNAPMVWRIWRLIWWNKIKWVKLYAVINLSPYLKCFIEISFTASNEKRSNYGIEKHSKPLYSIDKTRLDSYRTFSAASRKLWCPQIYCY